MHMAHSQGQEFWGWMYQQVEEREVHYCTNTELTE
jgi:hypothetical protein